MEELARGGVPMLEGAIRVNCYNYILGDSLTGRGPPPELSRWHWLLHLCV